MTTGGDYVEELEARVARQETAIRVLRRLSMVAILLGAGAIALCGMVIRQQRRGLVTHSLFATELNIPIDFIASPEAGIAPALDRKSISLWLTSAVMSPAAQARIDVATSGEAYLRFHDRRRQRIQLGLNANGDPVLEFFDASGHVYWSAPPPSGASSAVK